jgi:CRP-like cAMP-binding protein
MTHSGESGNRLLAMLPAADFDLLIPELESVALDQDMVLLRTGDPTEHVFFPHSGVISLMVEMANGQTVATALVGREGAIGSISVFGPSPSAITATVRIAGTASRISASRFCAAFNRSPAIRVALQSDADPASARHRVQRAAPRQGAHGTKCVRTIGVGS